MYSACKSNKYTAWQNTPSLMNILNTRGQSVPKDIFYYPIIIHSFMSLAAFKKSKKYGHLRITYVSEWSVLFRQHNEQCSDTC